MGLFYKCLKNCTPVRVLILLLIVTLLFIPHVGALDNNEPNDTPDTATPVTVNTTISAELTPQDYDYYIITANFTGGLSVNVSLGSAPANALFEVHTGNAVYYYHYEDYNIVFNYYISYAIDYVLVEVWGDEVTQYSLSATSFPEQQEHNYHPQSQTNLTLDDISPHTLERSQGQQYFGFTLNSSGMTRLSVLTPEESFFVKLYRGITLLGELYRFDVYGRGFTLLMNLTAGDYYFTVNSPFGSSSFSFYQAWVSQTHLDFLESRYNKPIFDNIAYGTFSENDTDQFILETSFPGSAFTTLTTLGNTADTHLDIYRNNSLVLSGGGTETFETSNALFTFKVSSTSKQPVDYVLHLQFVFPDPYEPQGNSMQDALSLETDYTIMNIHNSTDRDWFVIDLGDPAIATLTVDFIESGIPIIDVYDHTGVPIPGDFTNSSSRIQFKAHLTPDTYYVRISPQSINVVQYSINIRFTFDSSSKNTKGKIPGFELPLIVFALVVLRELRKSHRKPI